MRASVRIFVFFAFCTVAAGSGIAEAANLRVNCDKKESIRKTLTFLAVINPQGPNTLTISGSCKENLVIQGMDRLTLIAKTGATILDDSDGNLSIVDIEDSHSITLQGFSLSGGAAGVSCGTASVCYLNGNTVQGAGEAILVVGSSHAFLQNNTIENNPGRGSTVRQGSQMISSNDIFQNNGGQGITVIAGAYFEATNSSFLGNRVGLEVAVNSTARLISCTVRGNSSHGIALLASATAQFNDYNGPTTITANGGNGVYLEDLSFAYFDATDIVAGNAGGADIYCSPQFPVTRGVLALSGGVVTNCVEPSITSELKPKK